VSRIPAAGAVGRPSPADGAGAGSGAGGAGSPAAPGRAVFLVRSLDIGGAERQLVELLRGLRARGRDVAVIVFYPGGPLEADLEGAGIPVIPLRKRGRWDVAGFLRSLVREIRRQRPAVLHAYMDVPNIAVATLRPLLRGTRIIWGFRASDMELDRYGWLARLAFRLERGLSRVPDLIIVNSNAGVEHRVARGFPRTRMLRIPNGIDVQRFRSDPAAGARVRRELGIPSDVLLVGLVGRLDPMKDHPNFLAAAVRVAGERPAVHFVCVGDGPEHYRRELAASPEARALGERLHWVPSRADVVGVYNALDLLCLASAYGEGFPNVIGEAMACGIPCVATDVGDAAEIIDQPRRVVPRRDPVALADAISAALDQNPAGPGPEALRARIVENFSTRRLVERTEAVLWPKG
jgi:glycosyltransferase involved in cell wall biosynthesis